MNYRNYVNQMRTVETSDKLVYQLAVVWLNPSRLPVGLVSLGGETSPVIKVPAKAMNKYGTVVPVIAIAAGVFAGNENITDIILSSGIERFPAGAFAGCLNLRNITIPKKIKRIKEGTFAGCVNLENVYYEGTRDEWNAVEIVHDRHEIEFGPLISGTPVHTVSGERSVNIPGNEALFSANIHFRCSLEDNNSGRFLISAGKNDITDSFRLI